MQTRVRVQLTSVTCRRSDRTSGASRFFVTGAAVSNDGQVQAIITTPSSISDGETRQFNAPEDLLFDGVLDREGSLALALVARDDTVPKAWQQRGDWLEAIEQSIANADASGAVAIGVRLAAASDVGWALLFAALGLGMSLGMYFMLPTPGTDVLLGHLTMVVAAGGAASETGEWLCEAHGAFYSVRYEVTRASPESETVKPGPSGDRRLMLVTASPDSVVRGRSTRMTISAVDATTGAPVVGRVRLLDLNGIFGTDEPFDATFPAESMTGIRGAIARAFTRMPLAAFDDGFDWAALEHRTPKGLVTAAGYDAGAVMFEVS